MNFICDDKQTNKQRRYSKCCQLNTTRAEWQKLSRALSKMSQVPLNLQWYQPQIVLTRENAEPEKDRVNFRFKLENPHCFIHILHVSGRFSVKFFESGQVFNVDFLEPK